MESQVIDDEAADVLMEIVESGVFPASSTYNCHLITKLCQSGFVGKAWDFFHAVKRGGGLIETVCCNALLTGLFKNKDFAKMNLLFSEMKDWDMRPNKITHGILINCLCHSNQAKDAQKVLDELVLRTRPSIHMCTAVIDGLCRERRLKDAIKFLSEMKNKYAMPPNTSAYNILINTYCKMGEIDTAKILMARMEEKGVPLNTITINIIIDGMCRIGKVRNALMFFRSTAAETSLSGDSVTYCTLIGAYLRIEKNVKKAMTLFAEMLRSGHNPDAILHRIMMQGFVQMGKIDMACRIASQMQKEGLQLNVRDYNILINGLSKTKNSDDEVQKLLIEMKTSGLKPSAVTYTTLISRVDVSTANRLFNDMVRRGLKPSVVTYGALIHCHCKSGKFDEAMKIYRSLPESGIRPDNAIYSSLFNHLSDEKNVDYVLSLLDEMRDVGVTPNIVTYNAIFRWLRGRNELDAACELMDTMKKEGRKPDSTTLRVLTKWLSDAGQISRLNRINLTQQNYSLNDLTNQ
ncbi:hypothetical protein ZOSMA_71G00490 [Zostera marina]|uniref:Pentatricopeptide repeat-containing protein n=1 Tax=Zostera marina TaxID=29655 RepID=A0A0K9NSK3_ZOSMR|nr:hypothetical protein ZOSMA_71G00490 [Zostera marina]